MRLYTQPRSPYLFFDVHVDGKRHRISTKETTQRAAQKSADDYMLRLGSGEAGGRKHPAPTLQTFSERFFQWADNTSTLEPNTKKFYAYGWRLLSFSILAQTPIDQIDAELVDTITFERPVIDPRTRKETGGWVGCGKTYSQQALRTLRVILSKAHEWKVIKYKVSFTIGKTQTRDGLITPEIEAIILRELDGWRTRKPWLVVITLMDTGFRPSEAFSMRLENIDCGGRRI